jgi:hypothetical protein
MSCNITLIPCDYIEHENYVLYQEKRMNNEVY